MSMPHDISLILTLTGGLGAALVLGFVTQKLRLSPLVGYLLAGILVGPHSPGFVADAGLASQLAEIGIILLMFGVGLHFHLKDLLAVRGIALGGAAVQITLTTLSCMFLLQFWGFSLWAGAVFGMSVSVASTVVLTRVLADNHVLHTPTGHVALGWLVVEDLFTILLLVLLPVVLGAGEGNIWWILGKTLLKLAALTAFTLVAGQRLIPALLGYVARTGTRDLFTLAVIVLALGIAVGSALFFDASMAFGAFLAGMWWGSPISAPAPPPRPCPCLMPSPCCSSCPWACFSIPPPCWSNGPSSCWPWASSCCSSPCWPSWSASRPASRCVWPFPWACRWAR